MDIDPVKSSIKPWKALSTRLHYIYCSSLNLTVWKSFFSLELEFRAEVSMLPKNCWKLSVVQSQSSIWFLLWRHRKKLLVVVCWLKHPNKKLSHFEKCNGKMVRVFSWSFNHGFSEWIFWNITFLKVLFSNLDFQVFSTFWLALVGKIRSQLEKTPENNVLFEY